MASPAALTHARLILNFANTAQDDPRLTRIDLLQVGNHMANSSVANPKLSSVLASVRDFVRGQAILPEDLQAATQNGYPRIPSLPGPVSYIYAGLRLAAHAALRNDHFVSTYEKSIQDLDGLASKVTKALQSSEKDLFSAGIAVAASSAAESADFRSRLMAAGKDVNQIVTGDEFPSPANFRKRLVIQPEWPPLRLGIRPISGGLWRETTEDWVDEGGGGEGQVSICSIPSGSTAGDVACAAVCVAVVIIILACK